MIRQTYGDLAPELSRIAGQTGLPVDDPMMLTRFNRATLELMQAGDFPGVVDRWKFRVWNGHVTLPGDLERLMGICVNGRPVEMRAPWFEFCEGGPGIEEHRQEHENWLMFDRDHIAVDRSEVCVVNQVPDDGSQWFLQVKCDLDERVDTVEPSILIHGYSGVDGSWLRSQQNGVQADGILLALNGDSGTHSTTSTVTVSSVAGIQKPVTNGAVHLFAVSGGNSVHLSTFAPNETRPSYRRYFLPHLGRRPHGHGIVTRCRRRYVPVTGNNDFVIISNINAMEAMMMAQAKRESGDVSGYAAFRQSAVALMTEEATAYHGKIKTPALTVARGFSIGDFAQPI